MNDQHIFNFDDVEVDERRSRLIPWIVIGVIAIIAILISLIVINTMSGNDDPEPTPTAEPTPEPTTEPESPPTSPTTPSEPTPTATPPAGDNPDDAIDTSGVVIGTTSTIEVPWDGWEVTIDVPNKLNSWTYEIDIDNRYLVFDSDLINRLPESCSAMRNQWGIERLGEGEFAPYSPQQVCEENESLYIEILGLIRSIPESIQPME